MSEVKTKPELAWEVSNRYLGEDSIEVVFADTRNIARSVVANNSSRGICRTDVDLVNDPEIEYIDLNAKRLKIVDGMADEPLWSIALKLVKEAGWTWNGYEAEDLQTDDNIEAFKADFNREWSEK